MNIINKYSLYFIIFLASWFVIVIDINIYIKSICFFIFSYLIIYSKIKKIKYVFFIPIILSLIITLLNLDNKTIIENTSLLKLNSYNENFYKNIFGVHYKLIKRNFLKNFSDCYDDYNNCFDNNNIKETYISIDQNIFNIDNKISRKVSDINFNSIDTLRPAFVNYRDSRINLNIILDRNIHKIKDIPYYTIFSNLPSIKKICYRGEIIIESKISNYYFSKNTQCINIENIKITKIIGVQSGYDELAIKIYKKNNSNLYFNYLIGLFIFIFLLMHFDLYSLYKKNFVLNLSVLTSTILLLSLFYFLSEFNPTDSYVFSVAQFNPLNSYFLMSYNVDGRAYLQLVYKMFSNFPNNGFISVLEGGSSSFWFAPGTRYFLFIEKVIFGDFVYIQLFIMLLTPKILHLYFRNKFSDYTSNLIILFFLFYPLLFLKPLFPNIHSFINYYQIILHTFWGMSEPLALVFVYLGFYYFFNNYYKNYFICNILFYFAVILKPQYLITIFILIFLKFIKDLFINKNFNKTPFYIIILFLYLLPLFHNLYFGNNFTLMTDYGSAVLNIKNIMNNIVSSNPIPSADDLIFDSSFYYSMLNDWGFWLMIIVVLFPSVNKYLKIIIVTQYMSLMYFPYKDRYWWLFYIMLIEAIVFLIISQLNKIKSNLQKKLT